MEPHHCGKMIMEESLNSDQKSDIDIKPDSITWLEPETLEFFEHHSSGRACLTIQGDRTCLGIIARTAFPKSDLNSYVQFYQIKPDGNRGESIGVIRDIRALSQESRQIIERILRQEHMIARIVRILEIRDRQWIVEVDIQTDRGRRTIMIDNIYKQITVGESDRITVSDMFGNRYDIPDVRQLDAESRKYLSSYM